MRNVEAQFIRAHAEEGGELDGEGGFGAAAGGGVGTDAVVVAFPDCFLHHPDAVYGKRDGVIGHDGDPRSGGNPGEEQLFHEGDHGSIGDHQVVFSTLFAGVVEGYPGGARQSGIPELVGANGDGGRTSRIVFCFVGITSLRKESNR